MGEKKHHSTDTETTLHSQSTFIPPGLAFKGECGSVQVLNLGKEL